MRRSLLKVMCVVLLLCVAWIAIAPDLDIEPTAFRFAVFAAAVLFLLRCAFKYARPAQVFAIDALLKMPLTEVFSSPSRSSVVIPLRC